MIQPECQQKDYNAILPIFPLANYDIIIDIKSWLKNECEKIENREC